MKILVKLRVHKLCSAGFPGSSTGKESACSAGDTGSMPGLGRFPGEGIAHPLQYSWASLVAQMVKNRLQCERPGFDPWVGKIPWRRAWQPTPVLLPGESPWTEESGKLQSMGSQRVEHDWETKHKLCSIRILKLQYVVFFPYVQLEFWSCCNMLCIFLAGKIFTVSGEFTSVWIEF